MIIVFVGKQRHESLAEETFGRLLREPSFGTRLRGGIPRVILINVQRTEVLQGLELI